MSKLTKFKVRKSQFPLDFRIDNTTRDTNIKTLTAMPGTVFEEGTEETAETYNGLQLGLVHSVTPVKSVANSIDYYTCDIEGIADFGMHNELKLQMKITATNEYDQPKIKMAGNDYQIMRFDGAQLTPVLTGQLKADNIYNLSFNGTLFILSSGIIAEKEVKALLDTTDFQATETTNGTSKIATQTEVNNGLEDTKIVTSKKLKARLDSLLAGITSTYVKLTQLSTESLAGIIKISTTAQVSAGTDNTTAVSPAKLSEAFANLKATNGYQKMSNGVIIQWGMIAYTAPSSVSGDITKKNVNFPVVFPTKMLSITFSGVYETNGDDGLECQHSCEQSSDSGFLFRATRLVGSAVPGTRGNAYYIAIGY